MPGERLSPVQQTPTEKVITDVTPTVSSKETFPTPAFNGVMAGLAMSYLESREATKALEALNIPRPDMDFAESVYDLMGDWRKPEGISTAKLRLDAFKELQNVCNLPDEQRELWMQTQPETMQDLVRTAVEWNTLPPQREVTTPPEQEETDEAGKQKGKTKSTTTTPPPHRPVSKLTALMKYLEADEIKSVKEARLIH